MTRLHHPLGKVQLKILEELKSGPKTVKELAAASGHKHPHHPIYSLVHRKLVTTENLWIDGTTHTVVTLIPQPKIDTAAIDAFDAAKEEMMQRFEAAAERKTVRRAHED